MNTMKKSILSLLIATALLLGACFPSSKDFAEKITPAKDNKLATEAISYFCDKNYTFIINHFNNSLLPANPEKEFEKLRALIPGQKPESVELMEANIYRASGERVSNLSYQIQIDKSWYLFNILIRTTGDKSEIQRFYVKKLPGSLRKINAFTLTGKPISNYLFLLGMLILLSFIITALIICIKNKVKRKWLWIPFIVLGIGKISINWATGDIFYNPLSLNIQLMGIAIFKTSQFAPWILSLSFPLGAVVFLIKHERQIKSLKSIQPVTTQKSHRLKTCISVIFFIWGIIFLCPLLGPYKAETLNILLKIFCLCIAAAFFLKGIKILKR